MARGPKKTLDVQIQGVYDQIDKAKKKLESLQSQREVLEQQKREEEIGRLYNLMMENGRTIEEIEQYILGNLKEENIA